MNTFLRILNFAKPYWLLVIGAFIASILFSLFNAGSLWVIGTLIGTIMGSKKESIVEYDNSLSFIKQIDIMFNEFILNFFHFYFKPFTYKILLKFYKIERE